jgi:hypothetical protein
MWLDPQIFPETPPAIVIVAGVGDGLGIDPVSTLGKFAIISVHSVYR